jgi:hypothetical protein
MTRYLFCYTNSIYYLINIDRKIILAKELSEPFGTHRKLPENKPPNPG